jgi:hypothetical protein
MVIPIINAAGQLLSPVSLCLQDTTVRFTKKKHVLLANNVIATCIESGKLDGSVVEYWIRVVFDLVANNGFLLSVDQQSPQIDVEKYARNLTKKQHCKIMIII